jgi:aspartokinase
MTISDFVKKLTEEQPFLLEALNRGIVNFGNLAAEFKPRIETALEKEVTDSAIVMALRRYAEEIKDRIGVDRRVPLDCEIAMKTNICDFNMVKSAELLHKLKSIYGLVDLDRGDFLNITIGNYEISIAISQKHSNKLEAVLEGEKILNRQTGLVALTIRFQGDFFHTPGVTYQVMQALAWKRINLLEIISTLSELTVVIAKKDAIKGYEVLHELIDRFDLEGAEVSE